MRNSQELKRKLVENNFNGNINQALMNFFNLYGYNQSLNTNLFKYLTDIGYTGQLSEKLRKWEEDGFPLGQFTFLFANNEQGVWYDPSDTSTLFQDSAGTTPVTASGQPVGLMLDKSGNGNHAVQGTDLKRPTYQTGGDLAWLHFDRTQSMSTGSIDFTASDQMSFFAGVRKLSDAMVTAILAELSPSFSVNPGSFAMNAPRTADVEFRATMGGTSKPVVQTQDPAYNAPVSAVMTAVSDISAMRLELRMNGSLSDTNTATQGTGSYGNYPLFIGARDNSSLYFEGNIYGMVVCGRRPTASEISLTEHHIARLTGVTL